jgi:hypothetical protein
MVCFQDVAFAAATMRQRQRTQPRVAFGDLGCGTPGQFAILAETQLGIDIDEFLFVAFCYAIPL